MSYNWQQPMDPNMLSPDAPPMFSQRPQQQPKQLGPIPQMGSVMPGGSGPGNSVLRPEELTTLSALSGMKQQQELIAHQRKIADMLRSNAHDQMQGVTAGRVYRGPGALNLAANVLGNYAAAGQDTTTDATSKDQSAKAGDYFKLIANRGREV